MQKWWETYYCFIILKTLTKHVLFDKHSIENYKIGAKSTWSLPTSVQRTMLVSSRYSIVASTSPSRFEAHAGIFRLLMKETFYPYVLWPFDKMVISLLVMRINTRDFTVYCSRCNSVYVWLFVWCCFHVPVSYLKFITQWVSTRSSILTSSL